MTTVHRPVPTRSHGVFAALATLMLVLALAVLQAGPSAASHSPTEVPPPVLHHHAPVVHYCFAMPHYPTIELVRAGCLG